MDRYARPRGWNEEPGDADEFRRPDPTQRSTAGAAMAAAMLGLAEVLEPHKTKVVVEQRNDDDRDDDVDLDFGDLPPLR